MTAAEHSKQTVYFNREIFRENKNLLKFNTLSIRGIIEANKITYISTLQVPFLVEPSLSMNPFFRRKEISLSTVL